MDKNKDKKKIQEALNKYLEVHQRIYELMFFINDKQLEINTKKIEVEAYKVELEKTKKEMDELLK